MFIEKEIKDKQKDSSVAYYKQEQYHHGLQNGPYGIFGPEEFNISPAVIKSPQH